MRPASLRFTIWTLVIALSSASLLIVVAGGAGQVSDIARNQIIAIALVVQFVGMAGIIFKHPTRR
jgi:hypothetical protein